MAESGQDTDHPVEATILPRRRGLLGRLGSRHLRQAEQLLAEHVRRLDARAAGLAATTTELQRRDAQIAALAGDLERRLQTESVELDGREAALDALSAALAEREAEVARREHEVEERRRALGAVELQRASVERREEAVAARERGLLTASQAAVAVAGSHLLFVPGKQYALAEAGGPPPSVGTAVEFEGLVYLVSRAGASPLPGDRRLCAFLEPVDGERAHATLTR